MHVKLRGKCVQDSVQLKLTSQNLDPHPGSDVSPEKSVVWRPVRPPTYRGFPFY